FSYDALIGRYNSELANGLGNLASRTLTMIHQYRDGVIPRSAGDPGITTTALETIKSAVTLFDEFEFSRGLEVVWGLLSAVDRFIVQQAPWKLAKDPAAKDVLDSTLYTSAEALRIATALLAPVLPESTAKIWRQLGMREPLESVRLDALTWGQLQAGQEIGEVAAVFSRIDVKEGVGEMGVIEGGVSAQQAGRIRQNTPTPPPPHNHQPT